MSINTVINDIRQKQAAYRKEMQNSTNSALKDIFNLYPNVTTVTWNQYTPSFNDGEPCESQQGEVEVFTNQLTEEFTTAIINCSGTSYLIDEIEEEDHDFTIEESPDANDIAKLISILEEELLVMFGDNVRVYLFRGLDPVIEEYDCGY